MELLLGVGAFGMAAALVVVTSLLVESRRRADALGSQLRALGSQLQSERAARQTELAWHHAVFEGIPVHVVVTDRHKRIIAINPAAEALFGAAEPGERAIVRVRHHSFDERIDEVLAHGTATVTPVRVDEHVVQARALAWERDGASGAVLILQDITERVLLARARRDLAANLGHELRTPLTSMRVLIETLKDGGLDDPKLDRRLLNRLSGETEAMIRLVEDMTTISLIESGRVPLKLERRHLAEVVDETLVRMQPLIRQKQVTVRTEFAPNLLVALDAERFGQVLTNLLNNAVKFTPIGSEITVRGYRSTDTVRLEVQDSGPGIPPNVLPRVFERFYKYDQARTRSEKAGTGIGLAVVKHLVQAHGGRVWAESPPGEGAKFTVELPAEDAVTHEERHAHV